MDEIIKIKVSNRTKKYFKSKGYAESDGYFLVNPEDVNDTNRVKVECRCDYCGKSNIIVWSNYIVQIRKHSIYTCHKCHFNKSRITFYNRYGTENIHLIDEIRDKMKQTNLEKYGFESAVKSEIVINKIKQTNLRKYGKEYQISSESTINKIKQTNIEKYGVSNLFHSKSPFRYLINEKLKIILNTDYVKDKKRQTCLIKYGVDNFTKTEEFKLKFENTCLLKYGVSHHLKISHFMDKIIETNKIKYGVSFFSQTKKWNQKSKNTRIENGNQIVDDLKTPFQLYRSKVDSHTRKNKKEIFLKWDGYDYYDGEYIREYLDLDHSHKLYPTIDHKICVFYGFENNLTIEEISNIDNLCITKRSINSKKRNRNESNFEV